MGESVGVHQLQREGTDFLPAPGEPEKKLINWREKRTSLAPRKVGTLKGCTRLYHIILAAHFKLLSTWCLHPVVVPPMLHICTINYLGRDNTISVITCLPSIMSIYACLVS